MLAAATLIPICVLGWLGLRILQQDLEALAELEILLEERRRDGSSLTDR